MKITKYGHACFSVEDEGKLLIVDPGAYTTDMPALSSVVAVVVTHNHPDHFDAAALGAIIARNPDAVIYAPEEITYQLGDTLPNHSVKTGDTVQAGPFELSFNGGDHADIHSDIPTPVNLGVQINKTLYYPGDSFTKPDTHIKMLALPVAAPWMKLGDAIDYLKLVQPDAVFPTHDAIASQAGKDLADQMIGGFAKKAGISYQRLTDPIDI